KGSKERMVLMGEPAAVSIQHYLHTGRPLLLSEAKTKAVFINRYGNRLIPRRVEKILDKYGAITGKKIHPHMLRHTFATHMLDGGADLRVVQELLGHVSLVSTQIYTHVSRAQARKIYNSAHPLTGKRKGNEDDQA
ncbi:tyrosine-type recombinase/integrase, partial [Chloroflexota bacterium]